MTDYIAKISNYQDYSMKFIQIQTENTKNENALIISNIETNNIIQLYYKVNINLNYR
jgi:hypothetical protein